MRMLRLRRGVRALCHGHEMTAGHLAGDIGMVARDRKGVICNEIRLFCGGHNYLGGGLEPSQYVQDHLEKCSMAVLLVLVLKLEA